MCVQIPRNFQYNHTIWFKYSFSSLGIDMFQAKFESSFPSRPIQISYGKWFIDVRFFRWQVLINKMTRDQLTRILISKQHYRKEII
jgi:hypothetical protein